ncbi:MAG: OmpA family protein [Betaproteobacteria bacterium]|nr:OmpA family protein [Betaproteobacteria bacterium]
MPPLLSEESLDLPSAEEKVPAASPQTGQGEDAPLLGTPADQAIHDIRFELSELKSHVVHSRTDIARSAASSKKTTIVTGVLAVVSIVLAIAVLGSFVPSNRSQVTPSANSNANSTAELRSEIGQLRAELKSLADRMTSRPALPAKPENVAKPVARLDCANLPAGVKTDVVDFSIRFDVGSTKILPDSDGTLDSIAKLLALSPDLCVLIEGYTDETGDAEKNMALSKDRASSVAHYLAQKPGIKRDRLIPIGKGSSSSVPGVAPSNPLNRRVVFKLVGSSD